MSSSNTTADIDADMERRLAMSTSSSATAEVSTASGTDPTDTSTTSSLYDDTSDMEEVKMRHRDGLKREVRFNNGLWQSYLLNVVSGTVRNYKKAGGSRPQIFFLYIVHLFFPKSPPPLSF